MARPLRVHVPDGWYHVTSRSNGSKAIFRSDTDRRRFLSLISELPERFGTEIHAFVIMPNHYHLLVRCRRASLSETLRWLQTTYSVRYNWAHKHRGHVFQGRFKANLIQSEESLDNVARYLHLNPVRIGGLGLSKEDQRRARVLGCEDPGAELVARRIQTLRDFKWSSWRVYAGDEPAPSWLTTERIQGGSGGRTTKAQRTALIQSTEAPIRQGSVESPWEGLVGGVVLGDAKEALQLIRKTAKNPGEHPLALHATRKKLRPTWTEITQATEELLERPWNDMIRNHGDWGRDAVLFVATRSLGWKLSEIILEIPGLRYNAAAQAIRRYQRVSLTIPERAEFSRKLAERFANHWEQA